MGRLVRFSDGGSKGLWSRVDLENGDPIWISICQTSMHVKRSQLGILGTKLFELVLEDDIIRTSIALDVMAGRHDAASETSPRPRVAGQISNPILRAFTEAALASRSASELATTLREAFFQGDKMR